MAGNIVKWWKHKILGGYKQFSGKKKNPFVYLIGSRNKQNEYTKRNDGVCRMEWQRNVHASSFYFLSYFFKSQDQIDVFLILGPPNTLVSLFFLPNEGFICIINNIISFVRMSDDVHVIISYVFSEGKDLVVY